MAVRAEDGDGPVVAGCGHDDNKQVSPRRARDHDDKASDDKDKKNRIKYSNTKEYEMKNTNIAFKKQNKNIYI